MTYQIFGSPNKSLVNSSMIDEVDDLETAERELYIMRRNHPSWVFWIKIEEDRDFNDKEIQKSVCPEP